MLSSEVAAAGWKSRCLAVGLGLVLLAGCQARPLYGSVDGEKQSVSVSQAGSRVAQSVRNELVLGFGGEQTEAAYQLNLSATSTTSG
ncbi:MAG: hypothetical protein ABJO05_01800, partial [Roseibium sp.]